MVLQEERSSESCPHCENNDLVRENAEQEKVDIVDLAANLEEGGTWYYVVDCASCKVIIPFKYAPEDEPILRFPTMRVRCFHCHTNYMYAADLISRRKAAAPPGIFKKDPPSSGAGESDREASRDLHEDRGGSEGRVILEHEIDLPKSTLRRDEILTAAVGGKRARIFFLSSCCFAAGWVLQLSLDIFYPVRLVAVNELHSSGLAMLLGTAYFGTVLLGFALFIFGMGTSGGTDYVRKFLPILSRAFDAMGALFPTERLANAVALSWLTRRYYLILARQKYRVPPAALHPLESPSIRAPWVGHNGSPHEPSHHLNRVDPVQRAGISDGAR
jgi:hypothetical protein